MMKQSIRVTKQKEHIMELMKEARGKFATMTKPTAKWKLFRKCNYKCNYCTVWKKGDEEPSLDQVVEYVDAISAVIPSSWRLYLTGGEPTAWKQFTEKAVKLLGARGYELRIISNFSAPVHYYLTLHRLSNGLLRSIFLTRHEEFAPSAEFADKVHSLRKSLPTVCKLLARQVVEPTEESIGNFLEMKSRLAEARVELYPLRLVINRSDNKEIADYTPPSIRKKANQIFSSYPFYPERRGTYCPAGFEYIYITPGLDAYTCIPYSRRSDGYLGNFLKHTVQIRDLPTQCQLNKCFCVPGR